MKTGRSGVFIASCEHVSFFALIADLERANICWVHIEKANTFEGKTWYIMRFLVVFYM